MYEKDNKSKGVWLLDSGSSNHICCSKVFFEETKPYNSTIKVDDGRELRVVWKGTVNLVVVNTSNGRMHLKIEDVLYVPDIKLNIIYISKLSSREYKVIFHKQKCVIKVNNNMVIEEESSRENNNLFEVRIYNNATV